MNLVPPIGPITSGGGLTPMHGLFLRHLEINANTGGCAIAHKYLKLKNDNKLDIRNQLKHIGVAEPYTLVVPQLMFTPIDVQSLGAGEMPFIWLLANKRTACR